MTKQAMFGAGCFWGVEEAFRCMEGVVKTAVGYSGGDKENPSYEQVCNNETGHAEVVLVDYEEEKISYEDLLEKFWSIHNPTLINRQGPDIGSQYRSAIFYFDEQQKEAAEKAKKALDATDEYDKPVATEITAAGPFYRAEEYHQQYVAKKGGGSCHI